MLVPESSLLELSEVLFLIDALEGVDEKTIVLLEDCVLAGQLKWEVSVEGIAETGASKSLYGFVSVEHTHVYTSIEISDVLNGRCAAIFRGKSDIDGTRLSDNVILTAVLITESVSSDNNWLSPAWNATGDVGDHNRFSEDSAIEDVSDGAVGAPPHLLEVKLFDTAFIGGDGGALYGNLVFLGGISRVDCDLIISGITRCD